MQISRSARTLLLSLTSAAIAASLLTAQASAATTAVSHAAASHTRPWVATTLYTFQNDATALCLDSDRIGQAYTHVCTSGDEFQAWAHAGNPYRIRDGETGLCLDGSLTAFQTIGTSTCDGAANQDWQTVTGAGLSQVFITAEGKQWCLDSNNNGRLYDDPCNPPFTNGNQLWIIKTA